MVKRTPTIRAISERAGKLHDAVIDTDRDAVTNGLEVTKGKLVTGDPNIAPDKLFMRLGISRQAAKKLIQERELNEIGALVGEALLACRSRSLRADALIRSLSVPLNRPGFGAALRERAVRLLREHRPSTPRTSRPSQNTRGSSQRQRTPPTMKPASLDVRHPQADLVAITTTTFAPHT